MAAHTVSRIKTFALTGTGTQDTVTLGTSYKWVEVVNHSQTAAEKVTFSVDGTTTSTSPADDTEVVLPSSSLVVRSAVGDGLAGTVKIRPLSGTPTVTVKGIF